MSKWIGIGLCFIGGFLVADCQPLWLAMLSVLVSVVGGVCLAWGIKK